MKKVFRKYILVFFFTFSFANCFAQDYWVPMQSPASVFLRSVCFLDSLHGYIAGDSASIYYTSNGGANWVKQVSNARDYSIIDISFHNANSGWAVAADYFGTGGNFGSFILKTTDGGSNWIANPFPISDVYLNTIQFFDSLNGYTAGHPGGVYYTTDGGASWLTASYDSSLFSGAPVIDLKYATPSYGFSCGGYVDLAGVIWKTTDAGRNWLTTVVAPEPIQDLYSFDSLNWIGVGGDFEYGSGIVSTTNAGENWSYRSLETFGITTSVSFRTPQNGWACLAFAQKLIYTENGGQDWTEYFPVDSSAIYDLQFTDRRNGYAVGDKGRIMKYNSTLIGIQPGNQSVPGDFQLLQNYPNPFNPSTKIKYNLRKEGFVTLKVYDISGKEVVSLKNENERIGSYEVSFDGSILPSGVYLYEFNVYIQGNAVPAFTKSRKMVLVK